MIEYDIRISERAEREIDTILSWIGKHSQSGASRWYSALTMAVDKLRRFPERCPLAKESYRFSFEVRESLFKTSRGLRYRLLFLIDAQVVRILHVLGPGQEFIR